MAILERITLSDPVLRSAEGFQKFLGGTAFGQWLTEPFTGCPEYDGYTQLIWSQRGPRPAGLAFTRKVDGDETAGAVARNWHSSVIIAADSEDLRETRQRLGDGMTTEFGPSAIVAAIAHRSPSGGKIRVGTPLDRTARLFSVIQEGEHAGHGAVAARRGPGDVTFAMGYVNRINGMFEGTEQPYIVEDRYPIKDLARTDGPYSGITLG